MDSLQKILTTPIQNAVNEIFGVNIENIELQQTRKEFEGDITMVIFSLLKVIKGNPQEIGEKIGEYLQKNVEIVEKYNVVKGFLNLVIQDKYFLEALQEILSAKNYGITPISEQSPTILVEYSSPNTNKPLHLGHIRNNLLGFSVANILEAAGNKVHRTQIINDRGIHICKSMIAWEKFGNGETPQSTGLKGDKLVGNYYVLFDKVYKEQISELISQGKSKEEAEKQAPIFLEAQEMLRKWEQNDQKTIELWQKMNQWVYEGFETTYKNLGVSFDSYYYESKTYLLGKDIIEKGLKEGVFYKKEDNSVWIDLTKEGLDEKLVLRSDGTSVYITQDLGTATKRVEDIPNLTGMVYTVGNEQDYHFKVLFLILQKLGYQWAKNLFHLSYGMVELPEGKMKSREGTVVDADELMQEMTLVAEEISQELGKLEGYSENQKQDLYKIIGLGALKYFILKIDPKKKIAFNPKETIDFQGNTGPFIQYTYARIQSILRKADITENFSNTISLLPKEKELIKFLLIFPEIIQTAAKTYSPAVVANYTYELVKEFNSFYQNVSILGEENTEQRALRVHLAQKVGEVIATAFALLGIQVPERM
ncbi:MAG: arginine--tRNA ligase [Capnocytophaga sp.]|nr:arginine--tRNA ligase [Capnocytophaga sp.]